MLSTFYHLTTEAAAKAILKSDGIDPKYSSELPWRVWYADLAGVDDLVHPMHRRGPKFPAESWILAIYEDENWFIRQGAMNYYYTQRVFYPYYAGPLQRFLADIQPKAHPYDLKKAIEFGVVVYG